MNTCIYKLEIKNNNDIINWYYNTKLNILYDKFNNIINLISNENIDNTTKELTKLHFRISLGMKCNYNCKYCSESCSKNIISSLCKDHHNYIKQLKNFIYNKFGNIDEYEISFWGGEPLLYFDDIKKFTQAIYEEFSDKTFSIGLSTNGLLLSDKITNYLIDNNFNIQISYDGPGQFIRNEKDIFIKNTEQYHNAIRGFKTGISWHLGPVFHKYNSSIKQYLDFVNDRFGFVPFLGETLCLRAYDEASLQYVLSEEQVKNLANEKIDLINSNEVSLTKMLNKIVGIFFHHYGNNIWHGSCMPSKYHKYLAIDMEGNIWTCHNSAGLKYDDETNESYYRGSIFKDELYNPKFLKLLKRWNNECRHCLMRYICAGGCPQSSLKYQKINCRTYWYNSLPAWYSIIKRITNGGQLLSINKIDNTDNIFENIHNNLNHKNNINFNSCIYS